MFAFGMLKEDRLTAFELLSLKVPSTMLCDSMVGSLFQHNDIAAVGTWVLLLIILKNSLLKYVPRAVVGADRIARNGDTANKVSWKLAAILSSSK